MKAYAKHDEILSVGHYSNELSILDVKLANLVPLWRFLNVRDDLIFKGNLMMIAQAS